MFVQVFVALALLATLAGCSKTPQEKAAQHKAKAAAYLKEGKTNDALLELRNALQAVPKDKETLFQLGAALLQNRQVKEAYRAFRQVAELDPGNVDAQLRLGNIYLLANAPEEARKTADKALAAAPNRADVHELAGQVLLRENRVDEALAEFDRAIALEPAKLGHRMVKATAQLTRGRLDDARKTVTEVLAKEPSRVEALLLLGQVAYLQKDQKTVDDTFARALKAAPESPGVWMTYGNFWLTEGDVAKALDSFRKAGEVDELGAEGWERVAELSLDRNDVGEARKAVSAIYAKNEKSLAGKYYEARALLLENKLDDGIAKLQEVVKQYPKRSELHYYLGAAHFAQGNLQVAKGDLQQALELNPRFEKARVLLAEVFLASRDFEQALRTTDELVKLGRVGADAVLVRAGALMATGKTADARKLLETFVKAFPGDARGQEKLGRCYLVEKKPKEALHAFSNALEADPKRITPLILSAQVLLAQKRTDEAISRTEAHIAKAGESAGARELLGQLYLAKGDRDRAKKELERAIELDPNAAEAYVLLARLHEGPDAFKQALADLDRSLQKRPRYLQAWMLKGALYTALGQVDEANAAYRKVLEIDPNNVAALNDLAWNLVEQGGNVDEALKFAEKAVGLAPKTATVNDTLGWIYVKKGVYLKAASHLELAVETLSNNPAVHYHLGKAYAGLGEKKKAAASLKKALSLSPKFPGADDAKQTLKTLGG